METIPEPQERNETYWLQKLEAESYQVELLISGVAIYGSWQLMGILKQGIALAAVNFTDEYTEIGYFLFTYLLIGAFILSVSFVGHFVMRALWIGLVGLASVFPKGIDYDQHERLGKSFLEQMRVHFPSLRQFNEQLDRTCSLIFAFAFGTVIITFSFGLMLGLILGITALVRLAAPEVPVIWIAGSMIGFILVITFTNSILGMKSVRDKPFVERYRFPLFLFTTRFTNTFFVKPAVYIIYTFYTNFSPKKLGFVFFFAVLLLSVIAGVYLSSSGIINLKNDFFARIGRRTDIARASFYEDRLEGEVRIWNPVIPSEQISGQMLKLFIPTFKREEIHMERICGKWSTPGEGDLSFQEKRNQKRAFYLSCYQQYNKIFVNDSLYTGLEWLYYEHSYAGEDGVVTFIPTDAFKTGLNRLRIEQAYRYEDQTKTVHLPFWFSKE